MLRAAKILHLRELIQGHLHAPPSAPRAYSPSGFPPLDSLLEGGLWKGALFEFSSPAKTSGASLLMHHLLRLSSQQGQHPALIDGRDTFDPQSADRFLLTRLLWIRCQKAADALRCADLLLRDGNLPLVFLDLRGNSREELRRIPAPHWYRLQRMVEPTAVTLIALTAHSLIPCADVRLCLESRFGLESLEDDPQALLGRIHLHVVRKRPARLGLPIHSGALG